MNFPWKSIIRTGKVKIGDEKIGEEQIVEEKIAKEMKGAEEPARGLEEAAAHSATLRREKPCDEHADEFNVSQFVLKMGLVNFMRELALRISDELFIEEQHLSDTRRNAAAYWRPGVGMKKQQQKHDIRFYTDLIKKFCDDLVNEEEGGKSPQTKPYDMKSAESNKKEELEKRLNYLVQQELDTCEEEQRELERGRRTSVNAKGLVSCPYCYFASIPPPEDKVFKCLNPECMKETCRQCKELNHIPLRCDEVVKADRARLLIEEKMTEALKRTCYKCQRKFFKEEGCNKMTCTCGALMCYICDKPIADYKHFNPQGGANTNLCPLWSDNKRINAEAVRKVAEDVTKVVLKENPNLHINTEALMPKLPPKTKGPHNDVANANQLPVRIQRVVEQ